jgi:lysine 2,3-aminomutase
MNGSGGKVKNNSKTCSLTSQNTDWRWEIKNRITTLEQLEKVVNLTVEEKRAIQYSNQKTGHKLKIAVTPYFVSLIDKNDPNCPIRRQCIPLLEEFHKNAHELSDPCGEEKDTVVPGLVHRYPDRALLIITDMCATYCRHCTRRRIVSASEDEISQINFQAAVEYIRENTKIRDVLISGGDPLLLSDDKLEYYIKALREIKSVEIIRIGTRVPGTLPKRITPKLCQMLKKYHPLYISIHFNHYKEITRDTKYACGLLNNAGIPLGSQTVLLKGINDKPSVMMKLVHELLKVRVKPYYIYQCDLAPGTQHFRTTVSAGIKIIQSLRGHTTGYAVPTYVIDAPGGGGKVPINPDYIISKSRKDVLLKNYEGKVFVYSENAKVVQQESHNTVSSK